MWAFAKPAPAWRGPFTRARITLATLANLLLGYSQLLEDSGIPDESAKYGITMPRHLQITPASLFTVGARYESPHARMDGKLHFVLEKTCSPPLIQCSKAPVLWRQGRNPRRSPDDGITSGPDWVLQSIRSAMEKLHSARDTGSITWRLWRWNPCASALCSYRRINGDKSLTNPGKLSGAIRSVHTPPSKCYITLPQRRRLCQHAATPPLTSSTYFAAASDKNMSLQWLM